MNKSVLKNQNRFIAFVFAAALAIFAITGCKDLNSEAKQNTSDVSNISFVLTAGNASRTVLPEFDWDDYVYDLQLIAGYDVANPNAKAPEIAVEKKAFQNFETGQLALPKNICYKFILTGYLPENNSEQVIKGEAVVTLTQDKQTIPFKMYPVTGGVGKVVMYIYFPDDGVITTVKADISETMGTDPVTTIPVYAGDEENTRVAHFITDFTVSSGKIQYVNINLFDGNGALVFDYAESAYVMNGATSFSQINITAADYYRKKVTVTITKGDEVWTGAPEKIIVKDENDNEYVLTGTNGNYTGQLPEGDVDYKVYIPGTAGKNDIDTGIIINPAKNNGTASGQVVAVKLPSETGLNFKPSNDADSGIISGTTDYFGNTEVIVPKDQDFKVEVSVKDGYEIPDPAKVTINGTDYDLDEHGKTEVIYNTDGSEDTLSSNVENWEPVKIVYTYKYEFDWQENAMEEFTFLLESPDYKYTVEDTVSLFMGNDENKYFENIVHADGTSIKGWYIKSIDGVLTGSDTIITAIPKGTTGNLVIEPAIRSSNEVSYTVVIIVENIEDDNFAEVWRFTSYGEMNTEVEATVHTEWLDNYDAEAEKDILKPDGSTVLKTKFTRKRKNIVLNANGGSWSDGTTENKSYQIKFEAPSPKDIPSKFNYEFIGWEDSKGNFISKLPDTIEPDNYTEIETYTAQYSQVGATYTIVTKKETLTTGVYEETSETKNGRIGSAVTASVSTIPGFKDPVVVGTTVTADGLAVVTVTYDRKDITLTFDPTSTATWSDSSTGNKTVTGKFGATVSVPANPVRPGYKFAGWTPAVDVTFPTVSKTHTATWEQVTADYSIQVYEENTKGGFDIIVDKSRTDTYEIGKTPTEAEVLQGLSPKEGFEISVTRTAVTADGNSVQTVKYIRKTIVYTFILNGGKINNNTANIVYTGKYGTPVEKPENPVKENFKFAKWDGYTASDTVFGLVDKEFSAIWLSEISGQGINPMVKDIVLKVSGSSNITATVQLPYESVWDITWIVDGIVLSSKNSSITISNAKDKVYHIYVEAKDTKSGNTMNFSQETDYSIRDAQ